VDSGRSCLSVLFDYIIGARSIAAASLTAPSDGSRCASQTLPNPGGQSILVNGLGSTDALIVTL